MGGEQPQPSPLTYWDAWESYCRHRPLARIVWWYDELLYRLGWSLLPAYRLIQRIVSDWRRGEMIPMDDQVQQSQPPSPLPGPDRVLDRNGFGASSTVQCEQVQPRADNARRYRVLWSWDDLGYHAYAPLRWWQRLLLWPLLALAQKQPVRRINRQAYAHPEKAWSVLSQHAALQHDWHGYGYAKMKRVRCFNEGDYDLVDFQPFPNPDAWLQVYSDEPAWVRQVYRERERER